MRCPRHILIDKVSHSDIGRCPTVTFGASCSGRHLPFRDSRIIVYCLDFRLLSCSMVLILVVEKSILGSFVHHHPWLGGFSGVSRWLIMVKVLLSSVVDQAGFGLLFVWVDHGLHLVAGRGGLTPLQYDRILAVIVIVERGQLLSRVDIAAREQLAARTPMQDLAGGGWKHGRRLVRVAVALVMSHPLHLLLWLLQSILFVVCVAHHVVVVLSGHLGRRVGCIGLSGGVINQFTFAVLRGGNHVSVVMAQGTAAVFVEIGRLSLFFLFWVKQWWFLPITRSERLLLNSLHRHCRTDQSTVFITSSIIIQLLLLMLSIVVQLIVTIVVVVRGTSSPSDHHSIPIFSLACHFTYALFWIYKV